MMRKVFYGVMAISLMSLNWARGAPLPQETEASYPVGQVSLDEVLSFNQEYRGLAQSYTPNPQALEYLQHYPHKIRIDVFYGGWCSDSRAHVPSLIKLLELVKNPNITTSFIAVDEGIKQPAGLIQDQHIERVPTFIVSAEGREIGRIVETPEGSLEEHLVKILKSVKPDA